MLHETQKAVRVSSSFLQKQLVHLHMQVLYNCNFRCKICHFWKNAYDRPKRMTLANARIIAAKLEQLGPLMICLSGGEPLIHKNLFDIAQLFSKNNYISLVTNGWLMTPEKSRSLFASGIQHVAVSLDYADPKKHDELRGKSGAYHRAVNALRYLQENRTRAHQRVHMITVVMDDNLEEIEPLIVLANKLNVTYLVNMYSSCRGKKENKTVGDVSEHLMGLRRKYRNFVSTSGYLAQFSRAARSQEGIKPCYAGKNLFNIDSQGNVGLCLDRLEEPVGNILSEDVANLKNKLFDAFTHNNCGDCWTSCRGGVEPQMYGEHQLLNLRQSYRIFRKSPLPPKAPGPQDIKIPANVALSENK
ncbi:MAG: radical SAM protein [Desulfobacteraceae bacterium]|nr:radical SAM protein [Desulfobacteraceae bacterium]